MTNQSNAKRDTKYKKGFDKLPTALKVAIISGIFTILTAIIAAVLNSPVIIKLIEINQSTPTLITLTATDTFFVETNTPTATEIPSTLTPTITFTSTSTPEVFPPDSGLVVNCISILWEPFPMTAIQADSQNCLQEPIYGIATTGGALSLRSSQGVPRAALYGIMTPISVKSTFEMHISLESELKQGQLWIGIVDGKDPTASATMVIYDKNKNCVRVIGPDCQGDCYLYSMEDETIKQSNTNYLKFELTPNELKIPINFTYTFSRGINYSHPHLFIGYLIIPGSERPNLDILISGLKITDKR